MTLRLVVKNKINKELPRKGGKGVPTPTQFKWLARGLTQAGGKLPLFDEEGQKISARTVLSCLEKGWARPWFENPIKPDWQVCSLTDTGRQVVGET